MDPVNPGNNHLSAGDTPLPLVYGISSVAYLLVAFYWFSLLVFRKDTRVFRAHWLMYVRWFTCHDVYIVIAIIRLVLVVCIHIDKALHSVRYEDGLCTWDSLCHLGKVLLQKERRAHWRLENWILHLCKVNQDYLLQVVLLIHLFSVKGILSILIISKCNNRIYKSDSTKDLCSTSCLGMDVYQALPFYQG